MASSISIIQKVGANLSRSTLPQSDDHASLEYKEGDYIQVDMKVVKTAKGKRSALMNRCVHKYCSMLSDAWNSYGLECVVCMIGLEGKQFDLKTAWTGELVKEMIFKPTLNAISGQPLTSKASDKDLCDVEEAIGRMCAKKMGLEINWPTSAPPIWRSYNE